MILSELRHSTAVRTAILFATVFSLVAGGIFAAVFLEFTSELADRLKVRTLGVHETYVALDQSEGFDGLKRLLDIRARKSKTEDRVFLLVDANGNFVAGNIEPVALFDGWKVLDRPKRRWGGRWPDDEEHFLSRWSKVSQGSLLIGLSDHDVTEAEEEMIEGLSLALGSIALLAILGSLWLATQTQSRIRAMDKALQEVARGHLNARVPLTERDDDLNQVSRNVNSTLDQIERLVDSLRQVSADIGHELKTPIGRLRQRLDVAHRSAKTPDEFRQATAGAIQEVDQIVETFEALLRIAQIEAGSRRAKFSSVSLSDILQNIIDVYRPVAEDEGQSFLTNLTSDAANIQGDREMLTQMFANLIENAIRHCPKESSISVGLEATADGPVASVSDRGSGIPEDEREKVFRRLYRLDKSRTTAGSGLGLSLVRAIAELHGARVTLGDNRPGLVVAIRFNRKVDK